jgi:hypothetical protein
MPLQTPRFVMLSMPVALALFFCGLVSSAPAWTWVLPIPMILLAAFVTTLASVHDFGERWRIRRWWGSSFVAKRDVLAMRWSKIEDVGVMKLNRFAFPWGRVYFVDSWSDTCEIEPLERKPRGSK